MQTIGKKRKYSRIDTTSFMLAGILAASPFISLNFINDDLVYWYGTQYQSIDFYLASLLCFCGWSLLAIYRKMREELQFRSYPIIWLAFSIFLCLFFAGFVDDANINEGNIYTLRLFIAFFTLGALTYAMILIEDKDKLLIRRLTLAIRERNWQSLLELTPSWLVTLACVYILCPILLITHYPGSSIFPFGIDNALQLKSILFAITLFLTRDILLILFFNLNTKRKRADLTAVIYLAILYWLIPALLGALGLHSIVGLFIPFGPNYAWLSVVSGLVQTAVLLFLILRIQRINH